MCRKLSCLFSRSAGPAETSPSSPLLPSFPLSLFLYIYIIIMMIMTITIMIRMIIIMIILSSPRLASPHLSSPACPPSPSLSLLPLLSCDIHTHTPAHTNFYKLPAVLFCYYKTLLHKLSWAWPWV